MRAAVVETAEGEVMSLGQVEDHGDNLYWKSIDWRKLRHFLPLLRELSLQLEAFLPESP